MELFTATGFLKSFRDDTRASVSVEFVLTMPILFWTFMGLYVFFDGYRQSSVNLKAAYTISDMISRETEPIDDEYIDSMHSLLKLLTRATSLTSLRVSVIRYDDNVKKHFVEWSAVRNVAGVLTDGNIQDIEDQIPIMPHQDLVIIVETTNTFVPLFNVGMENKSLENFVVTRPRFAPQVLWAS